MRSLLAACVLAAAPACERAAPPQAEPAATPIPAAQVTPAAPDPALRAPPDSPHFGVVIGELRPPVEEGMLVLVADVVPRYEGCPDYVSEFRGGAFRCEDTPLGLYTVFVRGDGTEWARRPIYLKSGELLDLGVIEPVPLPRDARIHGTVRDERGLPIEGVWVFHDIGNCPSVHGMTSWCWSTRTDAAGEFSLSPVEREIRLDFHLDGYRMVEPFWSFDGVEAGWGDTLQVRMGRD